MKRCEAVDMNTLIQPNGWNCVLVALQRAAIYMGIYGTRAILDRYEEEAILSGGLNQIRLAAIAREVFPDRKLTMLVSPDVAPKIIGCDTIATRGHETINCPDVEAVIVCHAGTEVAHAVFVAPSKEITVGNIACVLYVGPEMENNHE